MGNLTRLVFLAALFVLPVGLHAEEKPASAVAVEQAAVQVDAAPENADCAAVKATGNEAQTDVALALGETSAPTQSGCCKICRIGKACGDTCISRYKDCHVGPGCACDGY